MTEEPAPASRLSRLALLSARVDAGELSEEEFERELAAIQAAKPPLEKRRTKPEARNYTRKATKTTEKDEDPHDWYNRLNPTADQNDHWEGDGCEKEYAERNETRVRPKPNRGKRTRFRAISRETVLELGQSIEDPETRALFFTLYLTGGRVSEILELKASDIQSKPATAERPASLVFILKTLKRRDKIPQRAAVALEQGIYAPMIAIVKAWRDQFKPDDVLFSIRRQNAHYRLTRLKANVSPEDNPNVVMEKKINPHYLRRVRLSHLVKHHQFTDSMLREFVQWRDSTPAAEYVSLDEETLAKAQKENPV